MPDAGGRRGNSRPSWGAGTPQAPAHVMRGSLRNGERHYPSRSRCHLMWSPMKVWTNQ